MSQTETLATLKRYLDDYPRAWIGKLIDAVRVVEPNGYIAGILGVAEALLLIL